MTKKEMIQAMLDECSFQNTVHDCVVFFDGDDFMVQYADGESGMIDINLVETKYYKPICTWEDDVRDGKPVLCWVNDRNRDKNVSARIVCQIADDRSRYTDAFGARWKYATPVKPSECWGGE